jgi:phosphoribosylglycinamide formyltransferase 2
VSSSAIEIGVPGTANATRLVLLGSGELGREVVIEAMRLGCETVAVDSYLGAPAMGLAHRSFVIEMSDPEALRALLKAELALPCARLLVVPEVEAIATEVLEEFEQAGHDHLTVVPTARAARLTMNREGIRRLAAEELNLPTSRYEFCDSLEDLERAVETLGTPCVVKPVMSSSGKGQSVVSAPDGVEEAWDYSQVGGRVGAGRVICEAFVDFDYEITLLTVRHAGGTAFCSPIGHVQVGGDYRESWQPQEMSPRALHAGREIAATITEALGGRGIFGVELFISGDEVWFSEVSPRPHDTGMATMATQRLSQFALHARAILGLTIPTVEAPDGSGAREIPLESAGASAVILAEQQKQDPVIEIGHDALSDPRVDLRLFGKPVSRPGRRMGVAIARADSTDEARELARFAASQVKVD